MNWLLNFVSRKVSPCLGGKYISTWTDSSLQMPYFFPPSSTLETSNSLWIDRSHKDV